MADELHGADYDGDESVTVAASSKSLTSATYGDAQFAEVTCETATVRFWLGGTTPTATTGHMLYPGDVLKLNSHSQIVDVRFIRVTGTSSVLRCSYGT